MTIQRVREIFGKKVAHMSDEEILEFIKQLSILCDELFKMAIEEGKMKGGEK